MIKYFLDQKIVTKPTTTFYIVCGIVSPETTFLLPWTSCQSQIFASHTGLLNYKAIIWKKQKLHHEFNRETGFPIIRLLAI